MSGTSMDGIDVALLDVNTDTLIAAISVPYSSMLMQELKAALAGELQLNTLAQLSTLLGREFAAAVNTLLAQAKISPQAIIAIGSHGQTLCHDASDSIPYTVQLGCAHTIAELTGINVVADFRTRDLVIGGCGAPLAPLYHRHAFAGGALPYAVVNFGGIANISYVGATGALSGYDTGPGNCLLDAWIYEHQGVAYDNSGAWALSGTPIASLLEQLLKDPYFKRPPPKSLGKEYFNLSRLAKILLKSYAPVDVQATFLEFSTISIANAVKSYPLKLSNLIVCGGGVHNYALLKSLGAHLPDIKIISSACFGVDPDYIEAMMFAWLASKAITAEALDLTKITGARKAAILGVIYPGLPIVKKRLCEECSDEAIQ